VLDRQDVQSAAERQDPFADVLTTIKIYLHQQLAPNTDDTKMAATTQILAGIGALFVLYNLFSFVRLLASLFVLPGTSVSCPKFYIAIRETDHR